MKTNQTDKATASHPGRADFYTVNKPGTAMPYGAIVKNSAPVFFITSAEREAWFQGYDQAEGRAEREHVALVAVADYAAKIQYYVQGNHPVRRIADAEAGLTDALANLAAVREGK